MIWAKTLGVVALAIVLHSAAGAGASAPLKNKLELRAAASAADLKTVKRLILQNDTDVAGAWWGAAQDARSQIERAFEEITRGSSSLEYENRTALSWVLMKDNDGVQALLSSVATTAHLSLSTAAGKGYVDTAIDSLDKGVSADTTDPFGTPSLHLAAAAGHAELVQVLLGKGATPDKPSMVDGTSALCAAAEQGHLAVVEALLGAGADPSFADADDGASPLHRAVWHGRPEVARALLAHGASPDGADRRGHSALLYAAAKHDAPLMELLLDAGADASVLVVSDDPAAAAAEAVALFAAEEGALRFAERLALSLRDVVGDFELPPGMGPLPPPSARRSAGRAEPAHAAAAKAGDGGAAAPSGARTTEL